MEEPGCGAQFRAAVQVIQGLPRSGAYRPSYEEMLRFYSYYKQATAGRCQGPRPGFWDPIGRYKWDAWHSLGAMSKEEAMAAYVAEMKKVAQKVIDTVPMDESTQEMFRYFEPLYEVIHDLPRPPESFFRSTAESQGQQDGTSQDGTESSPAPESPRDTLPGQQQHGPGPGLAPAPEGTQVTSDSDGDTFSETLEQMEPEKMCGCPWGAAPSRGCRRSWRRTWPARCGRCRRSCGGCGSGSAAWRRSGLPRGRQTPARHLLHRPCPGGACPCPHARCSSWPPGPSSPSGCCATGRAGRGDPRPPPPPALLAIPLRTEPRGNRLSSHRDTGTDTEGQHRPPRRHHAQPEPEQPRARPGLTRDITEPASIKVAFSVQPRCLCPPARGGECGQTLRPQPLSPAGHPLSLLGHPLSPCRVRLQAPACPPPAGCNAHPEGATGPRSGGGGGEAPGLPGTSVRGYPVRGWAGRVAPAGSSPREAAAAPGPSCAAPPQTWGPPRPGHGSPRRVSLSGALKPCQPPRTWGPRGTSPPWLGVAGPGTGSGPGPAQGSGPPHPPPSPCPSPRTPRASGARLRTAPAKRDAAPLREDFFPLRFVYISLRQLQHRRTPHGTGILPLAPFPPGPAHPRSPSRAPYNPAWLGSARPGPVQPPRSRGRSMVGGTSAAQGLFSDRATAPPRGERARCPRRGPEGRGARASPRTGTPPPRGTARSRLLPLAIGGAAQE
ncbi:acyl-CoA-binding domain-containing protein 4 isoform X1 [Agelaius tricolor]|uniref:acyl-CoA-binding domain-containing protein 4 isoform X1 n=3 Tax=Agelaius tricolor TaxID=9191 RepID=UPI0039F1A6F1